MRSARRNDGTDPEAISGVEEEALTTLLAANNVQRPEDLPKQAEAEVIKAYKVLTGQVTPFADSIEDFIESRKVEENTKSKERRAINEFAANGIAIQNVDRKATRAYVRHLSTEKGLKNKTMRDRLSFLGMYWNWLVYQDLAPEDVPNPFARVELPKENCKDAAKDTRLPFTVSDITKLHTSIVASDQKTLQVAFMLAIHSGCRIEEIASLENASISENSIVIYSAKSPSGNRTIPLHPTIEPLVSALKARGGQYLLPDLTVDRFGGRSANIGRAFSKIKSGLKYDGRYVFHSLRKTVATQLEQAGVPKVSLQTS